MLNQKLEQIANDFLRMIEFGLFRAQKAAPRRGIEKQIADLDLPRGPVVFSGACFNGVVCRSYDRSILEYSYMKPEEVPPEETVALGWVHAGASGLLAALEADRGEMAMMEFDYFKATASSLGEVIAPNDPADVAPRRWVGTVGTIVVLNLAIGLRGMSDRWTHGLPAMSDDDRLVAMTWAALLVLGGLYTLRTIPTPQLGNAHVVARRLEERTARQSALGA